MSIPYLYKKGRAGRQSSITVTLDGKMYPVVEGTPQFYGILEALKNGDDKTVRDLLKLKETIVAQSEGLVTIVDGALHYDGKPTNGALVERILAMVKNGGNVKPMLKFFAKCMENPSQTAVQELHLFLEACNLPITDDGDFLAYKVITHDYKDCRTGVMDNSVGATVKMDRAECNTNRNETCSTGLHFCSRSYISGFRSGNNRLVVVKVNPKNVTAIPSDYNNAKGRACEYFIQEEILDDKKEIRAWHTDKKSEATVDPTAPLPTAAPVEVPDPNVKPRTTLANNPSAKLDETKVRDIRKQLKAGWKPSVIAKHFGVHRRSIERIRDGEAWTHVK
jgi:hypothetical protein